MNIEELTKGAYELREKTNYGLYWCSEVLNAFNGDIIAAEQFILSIKDPAVVFDENRFHLLQAAVVRHLFEKVNFLEEKFRNHTCGHSL